MTIMKHLSQYLVYSLLLVVILTSSCKKKKEASAPEKEKWTLMPRDKIYYGDRDIIAAFADADEKYLYFGTPFLMYIFDDNEHQVTAQGFDVPKFKSGNLQLKFGEHFRIFNNIDNSAIAIADNIDRYNASISALPVKDLSFGKEAYIDAFTAPDKQSVFYVVYSVYHDDTADIYMNCYKARRDYYVEMDLQWSKKLTSKKRFTYTGSTVNEAGGIVFLTISGTGYRIENGIITDTLRNYIKDVVTIGNTFYASTHWTWDISMNEERPEGLLRSDDLGKTWEYIGTGSSFDDGNLQVAGGHLYLVTSYAVVQLDIPNGTRDISGIEGQINTMTLFRNKVYIGTDAGVYVKSYKAFTEN